MKDVDDVLIAVADFLARMDCVTKISVANTKMNNSIGLVSKELVDIHVSQISWTELLVRA